MSSETEQTRNHLGFRKRKTTGLSATLRKRPSNGGGGDAVTFAMIWLGELAFTDQKVTASE